MITAGIANVDDTHVFEIIIYDTERQEKLFVHHVSDVSFDLVGLTPKAADFFEEGKTSEITLKQFLKEK